MGRREEAGKTPQLRSFSFYCSSSRNPSPPSKDRSLLAQGPQKSRKQQRFRFSLLFSPGPGWAGVGPLSEYKEGRWAGRLELGFWKSKPSLEKEVPGALDSPQPSGLPFAPAQPAPSSETPDWCQPSPGSPTWGPGRRLLVGVSRRSGVAGSWCSVGGVSWRSLIGVS